MIKKILLGLALFLALGFTAFQVSPWPGALAIRSVFNYYGEKANNALEKEVPEGIISIKNQQFDTSNPSLTFDVFHPKTVKPLRTIIWTHGGGFISGSKGQIENYAKILASKGYVVITLDYTIAPEKKYPTPLFEVSKALQYISTNHEKYFVDKDFIILGGDSAGSMITAQTAISITNPAYAKELNLQPGLKPQQVKGLILYCGFYDLKVLMDSEAPNFFTKTVSWSYLGTKNLKEDTSLKTTSIANYLTKDFPTAFISAGNEDPLLHQSLFFAKKLKDIGIKTDELFYDPNLTPGLGHEYQFTMNEYGKKALDRSLQFLTNLQ
ncbi:alpha/beta hydrolase [Chryseobacterium sp. A301]